MSRGDDEEEDEDEVAMDISETKRCYVYGQCQVCSLQKMILGLVEKENVRVKYFQEYSIDFKHTDDVEQCHKFCGKKGEECGWWTWEPALNLCLLYTNCTEEGVDPPAVEPCPECISGQRL